MLFLPTTRVSQLRTISLLQARSFPPWLLPTRHCMTRDRLRRRDYFRCRCGEDRACVTEVVLPVHAVARILLRLQRDAAPSLASPEQQRSPTSKSQVFPSHIRPAALTAAEMMPCDDRRACSNSIPVASLQSQKCIRGWQLEKDTNCALVPDNSAGRIGDRKGERLRAPTSR